MRLLRALAISAIPFILMGCQSSPNYVIPVDLKKYENEMNVRVKKQGLTRDDMNEMTGREMKEVMANTVGKTLPEITVRSLTGEELSLKSLIREKSLLNFTDAHCGPGCESTISFLPRVIQQLRSEKVNINVCCIIVKMPVDGENPSALNNLLNECKLLYNNIFLMEEGESLKLNVIGSPARMIVETDLIIKHFAFGSSPAQELYKELRANFKP